jgi:RimJ/RimL family protein N-acetyltransferase
MLQTNFYPFPILTTERLVLRQLNPDDDNEIFALRSDDRVNKFLDRQKCTTLEEAREFIDKINNGITNNENVYWGITFNNDNKVIGTICFWNISKENYRAETGFELHPDFQGKGIMHEALSKIIEFGFSVLQLKSIEGWTHARNLSSMKILEKNNFKRDRDAENKNKGKEELVNMVIYSLDKKSFEEASLEK